MYRISYFIKSEPYQVCTLGNLLMFLCCAAVLQLLIVQVPVPVQAANFAKAKQVYVPPTRIPRTVDYETLREVQSIERTTAAGSANAMLGGGSGSKGSGGAQAGSTAGSGASANKLSGKQVTNLRLKAESLMKRGSLENANRLLKRCFAARPDNALVQADLLKVNLARSHQFEKLKKIDPSIEATREAIYFAPTSATAASLLTKQLKQKGIDSTNANARLNLAQQLFSSGKPADALVEYCQSYRLSPSAAACVGLGNVYLAANKSNLAQQQYNLALQIDPRCAAAYRQLGLIKLSNKDIVGANSALGKSLELDGNDAVASKALINLWQQQVSQSSNSANAHLGLARAYQLSGNLDSARTEYDTVAQIDPNSPNLPVARASLERAVVRQQSRHALDAARTLESQGALEEAKTRIDEALAGDPHDPELSLFQGELLERMGRTGEAADAYRAVLYTDPENVEAARRLKSISEGKSNFSAWVPLHCTMWRPLEMVTQCPPLAPSLRIKTVECAPSAGSNSNVDGPVDGQPTRNKDIKVEQTSYGVLPAGDDITKLTNFMSFLHNQMVEQKKITKTAEHDTRKCLDARKPVRLGSKEPVEGTL